MPRLRYTNKFRGHRRSTGKTTAGYAGSERRGVRGDLSAVLSQERPPFVRDPVVEKPAVMIRSVRYFGDREGATPADAMTAKVAALYEYLMASARIELSTHTEHRVPFSAARAYLDVTRTDRLREYIDAMASTWVSYDVIDDGEHRVSRRIQLMQCEEIVDKAGERQIGFVIHPTVRKIMLDPGQYTHLELSAFPRFSCMYTARLYPKLALQAALENGLPIVWTPEELAREIGWHFEGEKLKFSNFENRVLKPVLKDIEEHVRRFYVVLETRRAETRGRPVIELAFHMPVLRRPLAEYKRIRSTEYDRKIAAFVARKDGVDAAYLPSVRFVEAASSKLKSDYNAVMNGWHNALLRARAHPDSYVGLTRKFKGDELLRVLEQDGVDAAFEMWTDDPEDGIPAKKSADDNPTVAQPAAPSAAPTAPPSTEEISFGVVWPHGLPRKLVDRQSGVDLQDASMIRIRLTEGFIVSYIKDSVIPTIESNPAIHHETLGDPKILRIEFMKDHEWKNLDFNIKAHPKLFHTVFMSTWTTYIDEVEYVA